MDKLDDNIPSSRNWVLIILILVGLWIASAILANVATLLKSPVQPETSGNVAVISVKGAITADGSQETFGSRGASSTAIVDLLEEAEEDDKIKAVILEINSPGGSAVASEEIAQKVKSLNKTTVAWIREVGASGAYWVASASDHIVASKVSTTGSIGVLASYLEYSDLLERFNITYERLVGGEYKDLGSPFKELGPEEREILMEKIDYVHEYFIERVAANRNMSVSEVGEFANGLAYLGAEAEEMGLIDELGGKEEAVNHVEEELNISAKLVTLQKKRTFIDVLGGLAAKHGYFTGAGLSDSFEVKDRGFIAKT